MDQDNTFESFTTPPPAAWPSGIDPVLIALLALGGASLLCTCLLWLGERRARAESEANARAFRAAAIQQAAQGSESTRPASTGAHARATAHVETASIAIVTIPCENTNERGVVL